MLACDLSTHVLTLVAQVNVSHAVVMSLVHISLFHSVYEEFYTEREREGGGGEREGGREGGRE